MGNEYNYLPLIEPIAISEQVWPEGTIPLVCTNTLTYNHEPYIKECLEGILMQKTTFPVQILIHEDASTDKTADVLKEYQSKYPNLIKVFFQHDNIYNLPCEEQLKRRAEFTSWEIGKYVALCEGDDYWIDPLKLQKQVNFMEDNPEYGVCHTGYLYVFGKRFGKNRSVERDDCLKDLLEATSYIGTLTALYRKDIYDTLPHYFIEKNYPFGDLPLWIEFASVSKIKYLPEITAKYRVLLNSASHDEDIEKEIEFYKLSVDCRLFYSEKLNFPISKKKLFYTFHAIIIKRAYEKKRKYIARKYFKELRKISTPSLKITYFYLRSQYRLFDYIMGVLYKILIFFI